MHLLHTHCRILSGRAGAVGRLGTQSATCWSTTPGACNGELVRCAGDRRSAWVGVRGRREQESGCGTRVCIQLRLARKSALCAGKGVERMRRRDAAQGEVRASCRARSRAQGTRRVRAKCGSRVQSRVAGRRRTRLSNARSPVMSPSVERRFSRAGLASEVERWRSGRTTVAASG
ncbi:hypothetical protein C8T65DRAFT_663516 [Cerioporus squamosus]|nr:hypothetical protein C8T65DRAFT_663516 [Cerioporus squamosus]